MFEDIVHATTKVYKTRITRAREAISQALSVSQKPAISVSGGKDSTALLGLVLEQTRDVVVCFFDSKAEFPETYEQLANLEKHFGIEILSIEPPYNMLEVIELQKEHTLTPQWIKRILIEEPSKYVKETYGVDLFFVGLRAEESKQRRWALAKKYPYYFNKRLGYYLAYPLAYLTVQDVFAYIYSNKIPIHPFYEDENNVIPREQRRVGTWAGTTKRTAGRYKELQWTNRQLYEKLVEIDATTLWFV